MTAAGKELSPLIEHLAVWGMRWARGQLTDDELDVEFLMWDVRRRLVTDSLPGGETVLCFIFEELAKYKTWWIVVYDDDVDLCTQDPGKDVDLYIKTTVRALVEVWEGDLDLAGAMRDELITTHGVRQLARTMPDWFGLCSYADIRPA